MKLPRGFIEELASYGAPCLDNLAETILTTQPQLSVRLNPAKVSPTKVHDDRVAWCDSAFYVSERPSFTFDPALHQGHYYVQDASSMSICKAIEHISRLENNLPMTFLDACAAPGGKTTAAIAVLPAGSMLVANEFDYGRAAVLAENIAKWGNPDVMVTRGDTSRFPNLRNVFDIVAADVPCSGEGMMRKDTEAIAQWSPALVRECVARQKEIIDNLWPALRPGGYLIYSTCTFNRHENEEMVDYICSELSGETIDIGLTDYHGVQPGIDTIHHCYRFIPGLIRGEGLFISVIRKAGSAERAMPKSTKKTSSVFTKASAEFAQVGSWLKGDFKLFRYGDDLTALPAQWAKWIVDVASHVDVINAGITVATVKGKDIIPSQQLAQSVALSGNGFPTVEVDYQTAIKYLRRDTITIDAERGFVLLTYRDRPLGFVKNLGNRANNLYPAQWRILSQNIPQTPPEIL